MFKRLIYYFLITSVGAWSTSVHAVLTIEITQGADVGIPVAIVPFSVEASPQPTPGPAGLSCCWAVWPVMSAHVQNLFSRLQSSSEALGAFAGPPPESHRAGAFRAQQNNPCQPDMLLCVDSGHDHGLKPLTIRPSYILGSVHTSPRRRLSWPCLMSAQGQKRKSSVGLGMSAYMSRLMSRRFNSLSHGGFSFSNSWCVERVQR